LEKSGITVEMATVSVDELLGMAGGGVLVLPNARAARDLRETFAARQRVRGVEAWESPAILSWGQWTSSLWSELVVAGAEERLLLNQAQELRLWREIVAEDAAVGAGDSLAELARSGWALAAAYGATSKLRSFAATHDSRVFAEWAEVFSRRCGAKGYLSAALLDEALRLHAERGALPRLEALELVGFGEKTPAQEALLEALRARGMVVLERGLVVEADGLRAVVVAAGEREELELAARWVRGFMEGRPEATVAVVTPHLGEERAELEGVLRETLAPELQAVGEDLSSTPWEFSGGPALASVAMIADALALARWVEGALQVQRVSALLMSPYVGSTGDRDASARFDAGTLRRAQMLRSEIGVGALLTMVEAAEKKQGGTFLPWLRGVNGFLKRDGDRSRPRRFAEWRDRALTATEFEATRGWESALDTVSTLDFSGRRVSYAEALEALEMQAKSSVLALPATGAAVQVMDVREAEGSVFDAVVFLRATDANWPPAERVHPLLPWGLQRSLKMPGSDPALAADRARRFTQGLLERSGNVLFSSAAKNEDGALRPSPLLEELGLERLDAKSLVSETQAEEPVTLDNVEDGVALPPLRSHVVRGGARVLKLQAACGFLAFAELRLRAVEPDTGEMGLDAGESGSWLHDTLQNFWEEVQTQDRLRAMSWAERDAVVVRMIDEATPPKVRKESAWDEAYLAVQKERMRVVLQQWLGEELKRGPFTVRSRESKHELEVGPLLLEVRLDRVDQVEDGFFLVDYKTGASGHPKEWEGERPDDPQMPMYALLHEAEELRGLAFARVRAGEEMRWVGVQAEAGILPKSSANKTVELPVLVEEWRSTLARLAEEFAAGNAGVKPKSYAVNCVRCGQRLLCRVTASSLLDGEDAGEDLDG
jgi:ATP-dependent helicase/nuclease subunit B